MTTCFARGISAKVQSLWDLIESQSTALVVRKQEHCLVVVQVISSNAKSNVHLFPTYKCYKLYVMCGRLMLFFGRVLLWFEPAEIEK